MPSRRTPPDTARTLRAEAGFGCVVCGCPIVEYHHIVPWAERHHYEVKHMVALCRNHHHEIGKQRRDVAYNAKANPFNIRSKRFKGYLVTNKENQALVLGNTRFVGFSHAISYFGVPLFGHFVEDREIRINCFIPGEDFFPLIEVKGNNLEACIDGFWDIEFRSNFIKFRQKKGEIFLSLDFRGDDVEVRGRFDVDGQTYRFSPGMCDFGGARIENMTLQGSPGQTAIGHGGPIDRLLRPNYAMRSPQPTWVREP